jgi:hypothetical protein
MLEHFKKLGSPLKCIIKYPTLSSQIDRYKQNVTKKINFFNSLLFYLLFFSRVLQIALLQQLVT